MTEPNAPSGNTRDPELEAIRERKLEELKAQRQDAVEVPDEPFDLVLDELEDALERHPTLLVDLWAPWCGPCRQMAPVLERLARDRTGLAVAKINVDENPAVQQRFSVQGIPTLLLFQEGTLVDRVVGAVPPGQLDARLDQVLDERG